MNKTMTRGSQNGMTYLGMLILMVVIAFGAIIVIKVMPLYLEHFKVESSLKSLAQEPKDKLALMPPSGIEQLLLKLAVNQRVRPLVRIWLTLHRCFEWQSLEQQIVEMHIFHL